MTTNFGTIARTAMDTDGLRFELEDSLMTRRQLILRVESLQRKATNAALWLVTHHDHRRYHEVKEAWRELHARIRAVLAELNENVYAA